MKNLMGWALACLMLLSQSTSALDKETLQQIMEGKLENAAIEFTAGTKIPLQVFLQGDLMELVAEENDQPSVNILRTFYLRCTADGYLFSLDGQEWNNFADFFTGSLCAMMDIDEEEGFYFVLGADVNARQQ